VVGHRQDVVGSLQLSPRPPGWISEKGQKSKKMGDELGRKGRDKGRKDMG